RAGNASTSIQLLGFSSFVYTAIRDSSIQSTQAHSAFASMGSRINAPTASHRDILALPPGALCQPDPRRACLRNEPVHERGARHEHELRLIESRIGSVLEPVSDAATVAGVRIQLLQRRLHGGMHLDALAFEEIDCPRQWAPTIRDHIHHRLDGADRLLDGVEVVGSGSLGEQLDGFSQVRVCSAKPCLLCRLKRLRDRGDLRGRCDRGNPIVYNAVPGSVSFELIVYQCRDFVRVETRKLRAFPNEEVYEVIGSIPRKFEVPLLEPFSRQTCVPWHLINRHTEE